MLLNCRILTLFCLLVLATAHRPLHAELTQDTKTDAWTLRERVGIMDFAFSSGSGLTLSLHGVPFARTSTFHVMEPGWTGRVYGWADNKELLPEAKVEELEGGGRRITLKHKKSGVDPGPFNATEVWTLLPDNKLSVELSARMTEDVPGHLEWKIASLNPDLLLASPYTVTEKDGSTREGRIAADSPGPGVEESTIAKAFQRVEIASRLGDFSIATNPEAEIILFDYRKNKWADAANPLFWFGCLGRDLKFGQTYTYRAEFDFHGIQPVEDAGSTRQYAAVKVRPTATARVPQSRPEEIVPKPKELAISSERALLSGGDGQRTAILIGDRPTPALVAAADFFATELRERYGIEPEVVHEKGIRAEGNLAQIRLGVASGDGAVAASSDDVREGSIPEVSEGYYLKVDRSGALVLGTDDRGVFNGATTLAQLIQVDTATGDVYLRGATIRDWPTMPFRGIHALSGKDRGHVIARAVRELMARYKINTFVWECQYIVWDAAPELEHPEYGMKKEDAKLVVDAARANMIDLIPLIQSLGHSEWIFTNDQNLDIAEDPDTPYAYMVSNPRTYEFIFAIYQEALDFFKPKVFHIGHDEVTMRGRFPYRSATAGKGVSELVAEDIAKLDAWFRERDIRLMMWGDMFLHSSEASDATFAPTVEEAKKRRAAIPPDAIIADWHYEASPPEKFISLPLWKKEGFETVAASWYNPENIRNLTTAAREAGLPGLLHTTWAGFNFSIDGYEEQIHQYWAYLWAAHYTWTGDTTPAAELPWSARLRFLDSWLGEAVIRAPRAGFHLDLSQVANRQLADDEQGTGWLGFGPTADMASLAATAGAGGSAVLDGVEFEFHRSSQGVPMAILMAGRLNPRGGDWPARLELMLNEAAKASTLHILMTAAFRVPDGTKLGEIEIEYADASTDSIELEYGSNVFCFTDGRLSRQARPVFAGEAQGGKKVFAFDLRWENPRPEEPIKRLTLRSTGTEAAPIIVAITGVE